MYFYLYIYTNKSRLILNYIIMGPNIKNIIADVKIIFHV